MWINRRLYLESHIEIQGLLITYTTVCARQYSMVETIETIVRALEDTGQ